MRKYPFTPILGWSVSRYDKFSVCKRWYYYEYYPKYDPNVPYDQIVILRSLTSVPLEIGNLVHDTIAVLLHRLKKSIAPIKIDRVMEYACSLVDQAMVNKAFQEVYYEQLDNIDSVELKNRVIGCLRNFFDSHWYEWIIEEAIDQRAKWVIEPNDFGEMRVGDLKAYSKADFLFPYGERTFYVLDWKTGRVESDKHTRQMRGYVLYARDCCGAATDCVEAVVAYLGNSYQEIRCHFNQHELDRFAARIEFETSEMYTYCEKVAENIPKDKDAFPMEHSAFCSYCNYRRLCVK